MSIIPPRALRAIPSRETRAKLRALGRRIAGTDHPEIARAAVAIPALARGERIDVPHFPAECTCGRKECWFREFNRPFTLDELEWWDGESARPCPHRTREEIDAGRRGLCCLGCDLCEHVPLRCTQCEPLLWVAWVIGAGTEGDLSGLDLGLPIVRRADGTIIEDWQAEIIKRAREHSLPVPPTWAWWPGDGEWSDRAREDADEYVRVQAQRADLIDVLGREIRFGSDPKKVKRAVRAARREGMTLSVLLTPRNP